MGSLYFGIATTTESAALGVIAALFFVWHSGKLSWEVLRTCFISTARVSGMILLIITAAFILNLTISLTGVADAMTKWVAGLGLSGTGFILALIVFYLILGMFMDVLSMQVATIPITFPIAIALGVDPIWFGIFIVLMCELGMITPPVGMNLFVVHGIRPDKGGIEDAIWGALPYAAIMILFTLLLMVVPGIATWLPAQHVRPAAMSLALWQLSATELQRRYRDGSLTPLAVAQACLARMDAVNPRLNAVVARRDDARAGRGRGGDEALRAGRSRCRRWTASRSR